MFDGQSRQPLPDYCRVLTVVGSNGQAKEMIFPKALDLDRPKRPRTTFSEEQLKQLEQEFNANQYLIGKDRKRLADTLGLSETQIKVWFQNRRTKKKKVVTSPPTDEEAPPEGKDQQVAKKVPRFDQLAAAIKPSPFYQPPLYHPTAFALSADGTLFGLGNTFPKERSESAD